MTNFVLVALAAEESEYTSDHIRLLMRKGLVKGRKVGGTWLVDQDDLKRYEAQMKSLGNRKFDPTRDDENLS
jgi:hypothetical protein